MIHKELFNLIWYRSKRKVDHPSDTAHGGTKDIMDGVVGSLYNAYTQKDIVVHPEDILGLSSYNSADNYSQYSDYNDYLEPDQIDCANIKILSRNDI